MILRARIVLPIVRPPIEDGAVLVVGRRIAAVGSWRELAKMRGGKTVDLGDALLLPGLVNAHCHLDYTAMTGLPAPRRFTDWIQALVALKSSFTFSDYAESWLEGARMLVRTGTATVGDIEAVPELLPDVWSATPLRVCSFLEMTGVKGRRDPKAILREATDRIKSLRPERGSVGLSPHALYSTSAHLLALTARAARRNDWRVAMHVAESAEESQMYRQRRGALFNWLKSQRDMDDCCGHTPLERVQQSGLLRPNFLAVHANCLEPSDVQWLAGSGASVVHCPRSHAYFQHPPFPRAALAARAPELPPAEIVRMATINGARALGLGGRVGEISRRSFADLIAIPFTGRAADADAAIVNYTDGVAASMIDGQWAVEP